MNETNQVLERIFSPRSIAIIGASETPGKAAERRTRSLLEGGYQGKIYPINPKRKTIFSMRAYPSVLDIEDDSVDLVVIIIPPRFIPQAVEDSCKKGAKGIIIITAGLGETGEEGKRIEAEILDIASRTGTQIIGPNCSGMFSASARINLLGIPDLAEGPYSIVAQSGNVIDSLSHYAKLRNTGFSKIVSAGNAIGVKFHEYLYYLKEDPDTRVIMLYLEGIKEGAKLIQAIRATVPQKPVVALKVGRTKAGARAAASHTGSLAGDDAIVEAAFKQAGIIRVSNVDELFDMAEVLTISPLPKGNRVAILSEGGGDSAIAADNAERYGLQVPVLSPETQERIKPFLLEGMPASNPIDYGGTAEENPHMIAKCCRVCMESDEVDGIYITGFFGGFNEIIAPHIAPLEEETSRELLKLVRTYKKPILIHSSFAHEPITSLEILRGGGVPVFESSERVAQGMASLMKYAEVRNRISRGKSLTAKGHSIPSMKEIFGKVREEGRKNLLETESIMLLKEYKVPFPPVHLAVDPEDAVVKAEALGYPVAMKIVSPDIVHKTDMGGVRLGLRDPNDVRSAFIEIMQNGERVTQRGRIVGVLISSMVPTGQECIIGMVRDQQFGPVIMFGIGGVFVEILKDVSFRVLPLYQGDVDDMIREIKGYRLLTGVRGERPKDIEALKDIIEKVALMVLDNPEIEELDLNPVIVYESGAQVVDSRIIIA